MSWQTTVVSLLVVLAVDGAPDVDLSFEDHRQLHWIRTCVVSWVDTPYRTVRRSQSTYGFGEEGFFAAEVIEAVNSSGWQFSRTKGSRRRWWVFPAQTTDISSIQRSDPDESFVIDHQRRIFESSGRASGGSAMWEADDRYCTHTASHFLYLERRSAESPVIAGHSTVAYTGSDIHGSEYEILFAPDLGCQQMRYLRMKRGFLGIVTEKEEMVVMSFSVGPPSPALFSVPTGYRRVDSLVKPD